MNHKSKFFSIFAAVLLAACLTSSPAFGQAATGAINGTVLDATGGAVPGAAVTVSNTSLGIERKLETTGAGEREPFPAFLYVYVDDADGDDAGACDRRVERHRRLIRPLVARDPERMEAHYNLANSCYMQRKFDDAEDE